MGELLLVFEKYCELVLEEIFNCFIGNHLLVKDVSASLGAFYHLDDLRVRAAVVFALLQCCDCFLCHDLCDYLISL